MSEIPLKKVLLVITKSNFGGAQKYVYDLATSLPREQFDVAVVFGQGAELEEKLRTVGIRTIKIGALHRNVNPFRDLVAFFKLIKIFKKERPDIVHLNSTKVGGIGAIAGRICHIPKIIFTAHGWAFNEKRNFISKAVISFLQWITVRFAHTTIAVSQKTAEQILRFPFIHKDKIKVIYNGIAPINFVDRAEARRVLLGNVVASNQTFWIGTISELHANKGIDVALAAFAEITKIYPQAIFVIVGGGEEKARLASQIDLLGLTNKAFPIGFVSDAKKYLKAFDLFTLTSRTEAFPYAILEAGLAELPVVVSDVGGIPEIINLPDVGRLVPTDKTAPRAIANAIEELINNGGQAKTIGQNLKRRVVQEFSMQKMCAETFALYK